MLGVYMEDKIDIQQIHTSISQLLGESSKQLALFLDRMLPSLSDDWWNKYVVNYLTFHQQRRIEQSKISSLASLDLSALLRVLDQNWYFISTKLNLPPESRHFVKEMQTIRNRWAHAGTEGFSIDDVYRDLDTLQRFIGVINGDDHVLQNIKTIKSSLLSGILLTNNKLAKEKILEEKINKDFLLKSIDQQKKDKINEKNLKKIEVAVQEMSKGWVTPEQLQVLSGFKDLHNLTMAVRIKANPKRTKHYIKVEKKMIDGRMHWRIAKDVGTQKEEKKHTDTC
jgi:hypothetical protein